jgi:hypothetical protein
MRPTSPALPRFLWTTGCRLATIPAACHKIHMNSIKSLPGTLAAFKALPQFRQGVAIRDRFTIQIAMRHLQKQSGKIFDQL